MSLVLVCCTLVSVSQTDNPLLKKCNISTGMGFAGVPKNMKSVGKDFWLQMDYRLIEHFSIALEFENFAYKQVGYFDNLPERYANEINVLNNNFSLLVKYHVTSKGKLNIVLASGWTYSIRHNDYYQPPYNSGSQVWPQSVTSFSDYRIPLLVEASHPVSKMLHLLARAKYNVNPQNGNNYSAGFGLSLKL